jgi:hypothetical protein
VLLLPFFHSGRPVLTAPSSPTQYELWNWGIVLFSDFLVIKFWGIKSFLYLFLGEVTDN